MVVWWVMNILGLLVVIPVVIVLANRVIRVALEIRRYTDDLVDHGSGIATALEPLPALETTARLAGDTAAAAGRYLSALQTRS